MQQSEQLVEQMTGRRLCLLFAFPCAEARLKAELITQKDYDELKELVENGGEPTSVFISSCFPNMISGLAYYEVTYSISADNMWSPKICLNYWKNYHGHNDRLNCGVDIVNVISCDNNFVFATRGNERICLANLYHLRLEPGDTVYTHKMTAIMKTDAIPEG